MKRFGDLRVGQWFINPLSKRDGEARKKFLKIDVIDRGTTAKPVLVNANDGDGTWVFYDDNHLVKPVRVKPAALKDEMVLLEKLLGPDGQIVRHPSGDEPCKVAWFPNYVAGMTYVTVGLADETAQLPCSLGNYEAMMCVLQPMPGIPPLLASLAGNTLKETYDVRQAVDISALVPPVSNVTAVLLVDPDIKGNSFTVNGPKSTLLLAVGITELEFKVAQYRTGLELLVRRLDDHGILPFTDFERKSVVTETDLRMSKSIIEPSETLGPLGASEPSEMATAKSPSLSSPEPSSKSILGAEDPVVIQPKDPSDRPKLRVKRDN